MPFCPTVGIPSNVTATGRVLRFLQVALFAPFLRLLAP